MVKRKQYHKGSCNNENHKAYNLKVFTFILQNVGWDNWLMIEIEKYPCKDMAEAIASEYHNYSLFNASLNCQVPSQTGKEYYDENKVKWEVRNEKRRNDRIELKCTECHNIYSIQRRSQTYKKTDMCSKCNSLLQLKNINEQKSK